MIPRYSRPEMARIWSEERRLELWLEVELAAVEAWAELGTIPGEAAEELRERASVPSPARVAEIERTTRHDLAAFVDAVAGELGPSGRFLHYGLTSSDIVDTALALQLQEAGRLLAEGLDRCVTALVARAETHRSTLIMGRTHGIHAEPTTFGLKLASFAFEHDRARVRLTRALEGARVGKFSGAVGAYATTGPELERIACERLGLEPAVGSSQIVHRDRHAEVLTALALAASSVERLALEIRHLSRTEVAEVEEPFAEGQKGSSAMPHKRNPIVSERICGLARVVRSAALVGFENVGLWHERDISHSSAERIVLPDAFLALDYMLDRAAWLVENLVVHTGRMKANLEQSRGMFFSQRLMLALVDAGRARQDAYRLVQRASERALAGAGSLPEVARTDREIAAALDRPSLESVFDINAFSAHADFVLDRARPLAQRKEPVHA